MNMYLNPNLEIVLPTVEMIGNFNEGENIDNLKNTNPNADYKLTGLAIFKGNKILTTLNEKESVNYNIVTNNVTNTLLKHECQNNKYIVHKINELSTIQEIDPKKNKLKVKITGTAIISEVQCDYDLTKPKTIEKIQEDINKELVKNTTNIIKKFQEQSTDVFGFKDIYYKNYYKDYNKIKDNYEEIFKNMQIDITSNIKVIAKGNVEGDIYEMEN